MLDFYADWCVYCIQMEDRTFPAPGVQKALSNVVLLQADVTANDDEDTRLLKHFGLIAPGSPPIERGFLPSARQPPGAGQAGTIATFYELWPKCQLFRSAFIFCAEDCGIGERQVDSHQHAQASVYRDSLAGASCLCFLGVSSAARLMFDPGLCFEIRTTAKVYETQRRVG